MTAILRPKPTWQQLGIGRTTFYKDYVKREGGDEFIPNTTVPRLRPIELSTKTSGFVDDEVDAVIEGLRKERDAGRTKQVERNQGRFVKAHDRASSKGI